MNPAGEIEVTIVGSGVIGLSCAWRLSRSGVRVEVLTASGRPPAAGASMGVLAYPSVLAQGAFVGLHRRSLDSFPSYIRTLEEETGEQSGYRRSEALELLTAEHQYIQAANELQRARARKWEVQGRPALELLSTDEARRLEPLVEIGPYGAMLHRASARVDARRFLVMLGAACRRRGVRFRASPVKAILAGNGKVQGVDIGERTLPRRNVIVCAGAWSSQLHPDLEKHCPVYPVRGQTVLVQANRKICQRIVRRADLYIVPQSRRRYLLGATTERHSGFDSQVTVEGLRRILTEAEHAAPDLAKAAFVRAFAGLRPAGLLGRPWIGPIPEIDGLYVAAGHYKTGLALAPITAEIIFECLQQAAPAPEWAAVLPGRRKETEDAPNG
ncbi:MAG TPA: FAD-dependent oxidoreductase [Acidobacteriota bacterium]|nr:FAD-dependent oxidoreductase [Acidobacteriota bacterium]